jgi:hypothetical protein
MVNPYKKTTARFALILRREGGGAKNFNFWTKMTKNFQKMIEKLQKSKFRATYEYFQKPTLKIVIIEEIRQFPTITTIIKTIGGVLNETIFTMPIFITRLRRVIKSILLYPPKAVIIGST